MGKNQVVLTILLAYSLFKSTYGLPSGAPLSVCETMIPGHGVDPQATPSPFEVLVTPWLPGQVNVTLVSKNNELQFKGFMLQARPKTGGAALGTFINFDPNSSWTRSCSGGINNSLTHVSQASKSKVEVTWTAPEDLKDDIVFLATFVQEFETFWVGVTSNVIHM